MSRNVVSVEEEGGGTGREGGGLSRGNQVIRGEERTGERGDEKGIRMEE